MPGIWMDRFARFFRDRGADLADVLDAARCREGWVQGELYLRMRAHAPGFRVNAKSAEKFFDFHAPEPEPLVGELKLLGDGYQRKVVTGGSLKAVERFLGAPITPADRESVLLGAWGLVPDYFRLLDATAPPGTARLLVLVADVGDEDDPVGSALKRIDFACPSRVVLLRRGLVRIWDVGRPAPVNEQVAPLLGAARLAPGAARSRR